MLPDPCVVRNLSYLSHLMLVHHLYLNLALEAFESFYSLKVIKIKPNLGIKLLVVKSCRGPDNGQECTSEKAESCSEATSSVAAKDGDVTPSCIAGIGTINHDYTHMTNG